ncbi:hypothetical protein SAMN02910369_02999 [Lachnospiraceae bacterium NE2001]|nr:hypothetical protein SAMN02910369_02999 [Lachnospiraceae bacterium NE2001]
MYIKKKSAIMTFYYLIAVDKEVSDEELDTYESIAREIDPEGYDQYKSSISDAYKRQIDKLIDEEDFYDVILEGVDIALSEELSDDEEGVSSRFLLWNILVVAFCDGSYSNEERRLVKHIVRFLDIDTDVFLEMEQLMKANVAVGKELEDIERSDRPYNEIRPMVEEIEKRREVIVTSARNLIEDELYIPVNKMEIPKNKMLEETKDAVSKAASNVANAVSPIKNTVTPIASNINDQTKKLFVNIMTKKNKFRS